MGNNKQKTVRTNWKKQLSLEHSNNHTECKWNQHCDYRAAVVRVTMDHKKVRVTILILYKINAKMISTVRG
jgi:hypothetical protein